MNLNKKYIVKSIVKKSSISFLEANSFLESFLVQIKNHSKNRDVKIANFGVFYYKTSLERVGRNPKTKESYIIKAFKNLRFRSSCKLKKQLN